MPKLVSPAISALQVLYFFKSPNHFGFSDAALLEHCVRDELNKTAPRRLAVIDPLEINIVNFKNLNLPSKVPVANHPSDESFGKRDVAMSNKIFIGSFLVFNFKVNLFDYRKK